MSVGRVVADSPLDALASAIAVAPERVAVQLGCSLREVQSLRVAAAKELLAALRRSGVAQ